jgi:hypothetical protein
MFVTNPPKFFMQEEELILALFGIFAALAFPLMLVSRITKYKLREKELEIRKIEAQNATAEDGISLAELKEAVRLGVAEAIAQPKILLADEAEPEKRIGKHRVS